jgi:sulfate transport system permease protein
MLASRPLSRRAGDGAGLSLGLGTLWLSLIVLLPLAAVVAKSTDGGWSAFWHVVSSRQSVDALELTLGASLLVAAINAVMGTATAWVLVRDEAIPGPLRRVFNALIDLPFALPTIVAGITLLVLYKDVAYTRTAIVLALLFVTLPFVVRAVQPVLIELDREMEEAAASLGASSLTTFRRIILPNLVPAIVSGAALAFARAVGEFGSVVLFSGNIPFKSQVASVFIFSQVESDNTAGAASVSVVLLLISVLVLMGIRRIGRDRVHG